MLDVSKNGIITLSRGDSFYLNIFVNLGTELNPIPYRLKEGDKLYFALMQPHQPFENALIRKEATIADMDEQTDLVKFSFTSEMTEFLMPGNYYYMVKLLRANNGESGEENESVDTIISKTKFIIID